MLNELDSPRHHVQRIAFEKHCCTALINALIAKSSKKLFIDIVFLLDAKIRFYCRSRNAS